MTKQLEMLVQLLVFCLLSSSLWNRGRSPSDLQRCGSINPKIESNGKVNGFHDDLNPKIIAFTTTNKLHSHITTQDQSHTLISIVIYYLLLAA